MASRNISDEVILAVSENHKMYLEFIDRLVGPGQKKGPGRANGHAKGDPVTCLECGRQLKVLARHLREEHSLTPRAYAKKHGLTQADFPGGQLDLSDKYLQNRNQRAARKKAAKRKTSRKR